MVMEVIRLFQRYKKAYEQLEDKVIHLKEKGLCGCVYTQWSDIEDED